MSTDQEVAGDCECQADSRTFELLRTFRWCLGDMASGIAELKMYAKSRANGVFTQKCL